jgi:DNA-binding GntR family transcriptional regulator
MDSDASVTPDAREIANRLREDILSGRLEAGLRLTEAKLTKQFGVGRGLVREAIQRLSVQGLLHARPNRGAVVAPEAPKPIRDLVVPIRQTVEDYALRLVYDDLTEEDFHAWELLLERMHEACERRDYHAIAECDIAFHRTLLERSHEPDLLAIWETLVGRIRSHFRRTQRRYSDPMDVYREHRAIIQSFRRGDLTESLRMLNENIE